MKFYGDIITDMSKVQNSLDQAETGMLVADQQMFIDSINDLEQKIKIIKDKCNEENDI